MAISTDEKYLLNRMNSVASKVQLGTLIKNAEGGGVADGDITTAKLAADAVTNAKIADTAVSLEHLDSGIAPSHVVKYAGKATTAGGAASEDVAVVGVVATDVVLVSLQDKGGTPRTIITAKPGTDKITLVFSGDPSTDHVVSYMVLRAAS